MLGRKHYIQNNNQLRKPFKKLFFSTSGKFNNKGDTTTGVTFKFEIKRQRIIKIH